MSTEITITEEELKAQIAETIADHKDLVILTDEDYTAAGEAMKLVKGKLKFIEDWFAVPVKKAHEAHKALTTKRGEEIKPLQEIYDSISSKTVKYETKKEEDARKQQAIDDEKERKRLEDEQVKEAEKLQSQGKEDEAESVISQPVHVAPAPLKLAPKVKGLSYTARWKFRIVNPSLIPRDYLMPDLVKIGQIAKAMKGKADIKGVEVYEYKSPTIR